MSDADVRQLRARWDSDRAQVAWHALMRGRSLPKASFGSNDGRLDFRGLPAPDLKLVHVPVVHPVAWRRLDLSGADLSGLFLARGGTIEDCRFDGADCRNWGLFGGSIRTSSFVRADLRASLMGKGTIWVDTDLSSANLGGTSSGALAVP